MRDCDNCTHKTENGCEKWDCEFKPTGIVNDLISRQAAIDAINGIINMFEQILRDIRESKVDDSVCGMCEYDGAYIGQSSDWCNECPGFDKDNCFKLSDKCRKRWLKSVDLLALPSAEPLTDAEQRIFLAAMGREEKVCKQVDEECRDCREPYEDSLVKTCHEITRKVKGALWT